MDDMKKITLPWARLASPTLAARRQRARLGRMGVAVFACLSVLVTLSVMTSSQRTTTVVVAAHVIKRGATIRAQDIAVMEVPSSAITHGALQSSEAAVGKIAQIDIDPNQPLFLTNARDAPVVPSGHTVLDVTMANGVTALLAGDTVSLMSSVGCEEASGVCTLADTALVMGSTDDDSGARLSVALAPDAALKVMGAAELGAIIAVHQ